MSPINLSHEKFPGYSFNAYVTISERHSRTPEELYEFALKKKKYFAFAKIDTDFKIKLTCSQQPATNSRIQLVLRDLVHP